MAESDGAPRNFRSSYYEKLGFSGNDEKDILDLLINSSHLDVEKLSELGGRADLDRHHVENWKVILGVECGRKNPFDEFANVTRVRAEHYQSLKYHLEVLLRHNVVIKNRLKRNTKTARSDKQYENHNLNDAHDAHENVEIKSTDGISIQSNSGQQIALMCLLEAGKLNSSDMDSVVGSLQFRKLSAMASFFVNVTRDPQEAFFLFRNFAKKLDNNETIDNKLKKLS